MIYPRVDSVIVENTILMSDIDNADDLRPLIFIKKYRAHTSWFPWTRTYPS